MNTIEIMDLIRDGWKLTGPNSFGLTCGLYVALYVVGVVTGWLFNDVVGRKVQKLRELGRKL